MPCQCESCQPLNPAPTYAMAYRLACEARLVLTWQKPTRQSYLAAIEGKRGQGARRLLEDEILTQWEAAHG